MKEKMAKFLEINGILNVGPQDSAAFTLPADDITATRNQMFFNGVIADRAAKSSARPRFGRAAAKLRLPYLL